MMKKEYVVPSVAMYTVDSTPFMNLSISRMMANDELEILTREQQRLDLDWLDEEED